MADTKRQSVAGGKAAAKGPTSAPELSKSIGAKYISLLIRINCFALIYNRIRVNTTIASHTIEGVLFAADPSLDLVAVRDASSPAGPVATTAGNYHLIPISQIISFKILANAKDGDNDLVMGQLDTEALRQREDKGVADAKKAEANIGKGVTKEAQEIFDHISRTYVTSLLLLSSFLH
jgi:hypothetical protein